MNQARSVRKKTTFNLFDLLNVMFMIGFILITVLPFVHMFAVSTSQNMYAIRGEVGLIPKGFNLDMYAYVLQDGRLIRGMLNTIVYSMVGVAIGLIVTSLGAYALSKKTLTFQKTIMLAILFTIMFGGGMIPTYLVVRSLGFIDTIWAMTIPGAVSTWHLIIMRTFFLHFSVELEEAAKVDGLNDFQIFYRIVVPLSSALFATIGIFLAVGFWNDFFSALLYIRDLKMLPLQMIVRNIVLLGDVGADAGGNKGGGAIVSINALNYAVILFSVFPILLVYPLLQKYYVQGAMIGSVKA